MNKNPIEAILSIFNKLTLQQKFVIGITVVITVVLLGGLLFFLNEPTYSPLYSGLAQEDASKVIEYLSSQKISYQIDDNGTTIKVPKEKVYETRLSLAGKGIPSSGIIGYELFDKTSMGMSEFMQKLTYKRALEGELARTIMQQDEVDGVRVHIVIPERSVFKDEEKVPTASVVLKLRGSNSMSKSNIDAIANLVSSSVEGLQANKVTILDTKGRLLSKDSDKESVAFSSGKQYEIKKSIESYLAQKAQTILDNVVGYGNSVVQVNADVNFDQIEKTMEMYDPDSQVAISEQTVKTENVGKNISDSTANASTNETINYEINKTVQRVVESSGNIKRLSVAVVLNNITKEVKENDEVKLVTEPRSPEQIKKLEEILKNAVGITPGRNDQFSIVSTSFQPKDIEEINTEEPSFFEDTDELINLVFILAAIIASIFILRGLMTKLKNEKIIIGTFDPNEYALEGYSSSAASLPQGSASQQMPSRKKKPVLPVGDLEDEISDEAAGRKVRHEKITNYVQKNPVDAAKLINSWLHEDEY